MTLLIYIGILILIFLIIGTGSVLWRTIRMSDGERAEWRAGKRPDHGDYDSK